MKIQRTPRGMAARVFLWAHRGASAYAPENTLLAFSRAIEDGADGIELDVRSALGGTLVVAHDEALDRVAPEWAGRSISLMSPVELAKVELVSRSGVRTQGIPTLDQAFDFIVGKGRAVNIEVKGDGPDRLEIAVMVSRWLRKRSRQELEYCLVSSFYPRILLALRHLAPRVQLGLVCNMEHTGRIGSNILASFLCIDAIHPHHHLVNPKSIATWKQKQLKIRVWTVNQRSLAKWLAGLDVFEFITDDPKELGLAFEEN
ncbi:MAG: glycerophosphodiester phosphodiesterase family protein [Deltaproteobacteria bacterium]|nr:glycerophosphodiester phosphodiesterase family protein [Deltaproteobacteria bacterium]